MRLAVLAVLAPIVCMAQAGARPRLVLDSDRHDFGAVTQGAVATHRFRVENAGDAPLTLVRLDSTCGCTTAVLGRLRLEPGERTELEVRFSSAGLQGPVDKFVRLVTDDPARPVTILNFHADVVKDLQVSAQEVFFRDLVARDRRKASVKLESASGKPIHGVAEIRDSRFDYLVAMYKPKKDVRARIELELLPRLGRGIALWKLGDRPALVRHLLGPDELELVDSDATMREP